MDFIQALLLGVLQGVFEWLPVSSEAVTTIVLTQIYGSAVEESVNTAIWLHTGTMLAALLYFRSRFWQLIRYAYEEIQDGSVLLSRDTEKGALSQFIVIATAVTAMVGGVLYVIGIRVVANYPDLFSGIMAAALVVTGVLRLYARDAERALGAVAVEDGMVVGVLQGLAVIPGISRSGSTVFGLLYRGFSAEDAFVLSFLLSVPAVFIANIGINLFSGFVLSSELVVAAFVALIVGYAAIDAVLKVAHRAGVVFLCFFLAGVSLLPVVL